MKNIGIKFGSAGAEKLGGFLASTAGAAGIGGVLTIGSALYKNQQDNLALIRKIAKETDEQIKKHKKQLIDQGRMIGSAIGKAITDGMVFDPKKMVQQFLTQQFLKESSTLLGEAVAVPMENARQALQGAVWGAKGEVGVQKLANQLQEQGRGDWGTAQQVADARELFEAAVNPGWFQGDAGGAKIAELVRHVQADTGGRLDLSYDKDKDLWFGEDAGLARAIMKDDKVTNEEILKLLARARARQLTGQDAINANELEKQITDATDPLVPVLDNILKAFGIETGASTTAMQQYGVPTATFSAWL